MKFAYTDESGSESESDAFVMAAFLVDAYRLRRITNDFDELLIELYERHPKSPEELKTKRFINGAGGWNAVPPEERKAFLRSICRLAANDGSIFAYGLSFESHKAALEKGFGTPEKLTYWLSAGMFITSLVQKHMQKISHKKGLTVLIVDDNKAEMPKLSDFIYRKVPWFDSLYQTKRTLRGKSIWAERSDDDRFDTIVNTGFAVKSQHSSLVQIADAISFVYRRHLELHDENEAYLGEREYFSGLITILENSRKKLGTTATGEVVEFYRAAAHPNWKI